MKKKKLFLNKETIASLNETSLVVIKGGGESQCTFVFCSCGGSGSRFAPCSPPPPEATANSCDCGIRGTSIRVCPC